jgi:hypothetical protein
MQAGTRYVFRLRIDANGITKCTEPTAWPDHPDCLNNGSSELPVLALFGPADRQWAWSTVPAHQSAHPQLWVHHADGTLTLVPLEPHGRLAWPSAAALLRGDERSVELRDGTTVLDSLYLRRPATGATVTGATVTSATATTAADPAPEITTLLQGDDGHGGFYQLDANTSANGQLSLCIGDLSSRSCQRVSDAAGPTLLTLSDPHGAGITAVVAIVPVELAGVAQLWSRSSDGAAIAQSLRPLAHSPVAVAGLVLARHHGEVDLRIGPTVSAVVGAER